MKKQLLTLLLVMISLLSSATAWGQVCKIGATSFATLQEALAYVNSYPEQEMTIIMLKDYTLPAGTYTLPANATLLVPMNNEQEACIPIEELYISHNAAAPQNVWVKPTKFRSLTFEDGVNMNVYGTIELSGKLHASSEEYTSSPYGPYGLLHMNEGAKMTLMKDSELRAWGFMTGTGETDARRGSTVREIFQIGDWKGGSISSMLLGSDKGVFPVTQYYIQNIESPVKYHPGALLSTMAAVSASASGFSVTATADVAIIGVSGTESMFLMDEEADQENTWVRKWYDTTYDQQVYEINSGAHIGSIVIDLGDKIGMDLKMNSSAFVLPLTNNMKIHLLSGFMDFTQSTALLPGAEVEINKESVVSITKNSNENVKSGALYIYDADEWRQYAYAKDGFKYTKVVRYTPSAPSVDGKPTVRNENQKPADASINVHGTFDTNNGYIFTSKGGANIFSTNADAGTFILRNKSLSITDGVDVYQIINANAENDDECTEKQSFTAAKLKNKDSYTSTAGQPAGVAYCYMNDEWKNLMAIDCYAVETDNTFMSVMFGLIQDPSKVADCTESVTVYIKPQAYVEVSPSKVEVAINPDSVAEKGNTADDLLKYDFDDFIFTISGNIDELGNEDHTFSDADDEDGKERLFILVENNCQWWEVEEVETGLFHCIHPLNDTYYYWDEKKGEWAEKRYTITWKNGDEVIDTYQLPRGAMAEYLGDNPTKPMNEGYTYTFTGWTPALAPVTADATYTAVYESIPRKYTVTLKSDVEGACFFTGAGAYDYNTTATIEATMNPGYKFVAWEHNNTLGMSFETLVKGDVTYTVLTEALPTLTLLRDGLTPGKMGTYTTAYDVNTYEGAEFYVPNQYTAGGIEFVSVDKLVAGTPYLFVATDNELWGLNEGTKETENTVKNRGLVGYLGAGQVDVPDGSVVVIQNHLYYAKNNYMTAGYAYFDMAAIQALSPVQESADAPRRKLNIGFKNNAPTGIENIQGDEVQSTKVLIDGTLYILRNGKMYDVTGKLVK